MHLDLGLVEGLQCIEQSDRCEAITSRIDHDAVGFLTSFVDPVDQIPLVVALQKADLEA